MYDQLRVFVVVPRNKPHSSNRCEHIHVQDKSFVLNTNLQFPPTKSKRYMYIVHNVNRYCFCATFLNYYCGPAHSLWLFNVGSQITERLAYIKYYVHAHIRKIATNIRELSRLQVKYLVHQPTVMCRDRQSCLHVLPICRQQLHMYVDMSKRLAHHIHVATWLKLPDRSLEG